jgi:hypothetical protein
MVKKSWFCDSDFLYRLICEDLMLAHYENSNLSDDGV